MNFIMIHERSYNHVSFSKSFLLLLSVIILIGCVSAVSTSTVFVDNLQPSWTAIGGGGGGGCSTKWTCTEWNACLETGTQTRTCSYPTNFCKPTAVKPIESQSCTYTAPNVNTGAETTTPEATTATPATPTSAGGGITGAVVGALGSPVGIGIIVLVVVIGVGLVLIKVRKK